MIPDEPVQVFEASPILVIYRCDSPVAPIVDLVLGPDLGTVTMSNASSSAASDALILEVAVDGLKRLFWATIEIPARSQVTAEIHFLRAVELRTIRACKTPPTGITEGPDPIIAIVIQEPV